MKIWEKGNKLNELVEKFTIGKDRELDIYLAKVDIIGTLAHIRMLEKIGLLKKNELKKLIKELNLIYNLVQNSEFKIEKGVEDIHSQIEILLTKKLGDIGKKIHSGRSRNDQVLLDIRLFAREQILEIVKLIRFFFTTLLSQSEKYKNYLLPGYTHLQLAMPSSFGLWFGAYAESLIDDTILLQAAYKIINQNPLGSAAGYGSSFPLNRTMTSELLGFENLNYNVIYAQMGRGKTEKTVAFALSSIGATLGKLAMDVCLFLNQNFDFISFPEELTTGSSIMPHKKNPDVFELIRAKGNKLQALPNEISMITVNLPSGYHRDFQLLKEAFFPAFEDIKSCLILANLMINNIKIKEDILNDDKYLFIFSVEELNREVLKGIPFREAYKKIADEIKNGTFKPTKIIHHTHEGSIGNLCTDKIENKMDNVIKAFDFKQTEKAINNLFLEI